MSEEDPQSSNDVPEPAVDASDEARSEQVQGKASGSGSDEDNSDNSSEEDEESAEEVPVEALVTGRERRATQGNRYATLLAQEADQDDELGLLFVEDEEEDEEFDEIKADEEAGSDVLDDSDTDDEDNGPTAGEDDLEGERQLEKEMRAAKRVEKRKATTTLSRAIPRKRVKIAEPEAENETETPSAGVQTKSRWQLQQDERDRRRLAAPDPNVRASSRTQTVQNKERTMASIQESEARRKVQLESMRKAKERKDASKPKRLTQAERLEQAAAVEQINSKTVSRWEAMEIERIAKQQEKLDALYNRKLEGPVISWLSRKAKWVDGKLAAPEERVKVTVVEEEEPAHAETKPAGELPPALATDSAEPPSAVATDSAEHALAGGDFAEQNSTETVPATPSKGQDDTMLEPLSPGSSSIIVMKRPSYFVDAATPVPPESPLAHEDSQKDGFTNLMDEIHQAAENEDGVDAQKPLGVNDQDKVDDHAKEVPDQIEAEMDQAMGGMEEVTRRTDDAKGGTEETKPLESALSMPDSTGPAAELLPQVKETDPSNDVEPAAPPAPKLIEYSAENLLTFTNFDETAMQDPAIRRHLIFGGPLPATLHKGPVKTYAGKPVAKSQGLPVKPIHHSCIITGQPARYRDPKTGLPYHGLEAYKAIQKLTLGGCVWSDMLGAWVGPIGVYAAGVPAGLSGPVAVRQTPIPTPVKNETGVP